MQCYIVDCKGNYYKIDENDQLVVAENKENAKTFWPDEAKQRIGEGRKAQFYGMVPVEEDKKTKVSENLSNTDWVEYMRHFVFLASNLKSYEEDLNQKLSEVDMEICDIHHLIELYELSEEDSLRMIRLLQERRSYRRKIKDEKYSVETFQNAIATTGSIASVKKAIKTLEKLEHRKYNPRKLHEIFEEIENKVTDTVTEEIPKNRETETNVTFFEDIVGRVNTESEETMDYVKRETVFDGKSNEWLEFAKKQVDFFRDAKQYMCNLNLELDEIEAEIENKLNLIEDANCNVTQGYKMFKELKMLRNIRKEKLRELECVDAIASNFDCEYMLEAFEDSLARVEELAGSENEVELCEMVG